jgi:peptide-methionine (S)-S-oxide reductase
MKSTIWALVGAVGLLAVPACERSLAAPPPEHQEPARKPMATEKATFAAGCFWGVEETFRQIPGVLATTVGYTGGTVDRPTYELVCTDRTGHAEAVEVQYDPARVSYQDLLKVFWENHDPTTLDRQGPDFGRQYRSAIFYHTPQQQAAATASRQALQQSGKHGARPIVTEIVAAGPFYRAEEYHQKYLEKRGLSSCHLH